MNCHLKMSLRSPSRPVPNPCAHREHDKNKIYSNQHKPQTCSKKVVGNVTSYSIYCTDA